MSELSKVEKTLEIAISTGLQKGKDIYTLPESISIYDSDLSKDFIFYEETFNSLIIYYAEFLHQELYGKGLFNLDFIKAENGSTLFGITLRDKVDKDDFFVESPNSIKVLFLMESLNKIFPPDLSFSKIENFYTDLYINISKNIYDLPQGADINIDKGLGNIFKDIMYASKLNLDKKKPKQKI